MRAKVEQAIAGGMPGEIHQNVDAVGANHIGDGLVAHTNGRAPMRGIALEPLGDDIGIYDLGIARELDLFGIVRRE